MQIQCLDIRGIKHDTLKAIAKVKLVDWGIIISDVKLLKKDEKYWASFPTKMYEAEGEKKYLQLIQFEDPKVGKALLSEICDAILLDMKISTESYKDIAAEGHLPF